MLRRDFIMVQIEELGKVIAQLIAQRQMGATRRIPEQIQTVYDSLPLDRHILLTASPEEVRRLLDREDSGGVLRMEIAIKALIEESYLYPDKKQEMLTRAKELLEYLQQTDVTFSFERVNLLGQIEGLLDS
ncbi:hypothetical protein M2480_000063 [Parabacteroides sp. PFB2-12]|uniref:hypothetical protein n=1 Tax=unclassified Parabacteroides TaxID=2649774 RepID=UPI002474537A|nr:MULTISPECIES: hypothetical protein [unclassified Parabacteroides]MDH6341311.1 hypothetical protein [Parabacteroides sp. PM6-13]MDH6389105.1 hypothetical protein [Parabacteroides sp. PFB2-12]